MQRGISDIVLPILIFSLTFIGDTIFTIFYENISTTYILFDACVIFLFVGSSIQYRKENEENKKYYIITFWIVAIIFLIRFIARIFWLGMF
jgi:hypothetical protein